MYRQSAVLITDSARSHFSCSLQFLPRDGAGGGEGEGAELSECAEIPGAQDRDETTLEISSGHRHRIH